MSELLTTGLWAALVRNLPAFVLAGVATGILSAAVIRRMHRLTGSNPEYQHIGQARVFGEIQTVEYYAAAWRDRRRRMAVFRTAQVSFLPVLLVPCVMYGEYVPARVEFSFFGGYFLAYMAAGIWLNRFRCPRCGKLYYWRPKWKGSVERDKRWRDCHYCGLQQDQMPDILSAPPQQAGAVTVNS